MDSLFDTAWFAWLLRSAQILVVLGGIILVHEFGHYIAAKWSGMVVEEFAVGVGPTIYSWRRDGTLYRICPFLFMGYVKILGLEGEPDAEHMERSFYTRPHFGRFMTILAGPLMNVIFSTILFIALFGLWGVPDVRSDTVIATVVPDSAAAAAGVREGWRVAAVDGRTVASPDDVIDIVQETGGRPLTLRLEQAPVQQLTVTPKPDPETGRPMLGIVFRSDDQGFSATVAKVHPGGPAHAAGLRPGDTIVAVRGQPVEHVVELLQALSEVPKEQELREAEQVTLAPLPVTFERGGRRQETVIQPRPKRELRLRPLQPGEDPQAERPMEHYLIADAGLALARRYQRLGVMASVRHGWQVSSETVAGVVTNVVALLQGKHRDQVGGPVMIVKFLSEAAFLGAYELLRWAGMLSIMIGVFNLTPLPALDGGRLVFIVWEWIFRRPLLNRRVETLVHFAGLMLLLGLMILISVRDIKRW